MSNDRDDDTLPVELTEEIILLLVDIGISCTVTVCHGLGVCLDLSQVLLKLMGCSVR